MRSSVKQMFPATNDFAAVLLVIAMVVWTSWMFYTGRDIPSWLSWVNTLALGSTIIWLFGKGSVSTIIGAIRSE